MPAGILLLACPFSRSSLQEALTIDGSMHQGPSVTLQNVFVELGGKTILQGVDLFVNGGTSLVIVGPSGSGKTVLLKTIAGSMKGKKGQK